MSSRILTILATLMLGSAQREAAATQAVRGDYLIPISARAPVLDGRISGAEWATGLRVDGFAQDGMLQRRRARAYITATTTHLYFAIWSELPVRGTILSEIARDSENLVYDDSVELWLDPTPDAARGARLQMLTNSRGHRWFKKHAYGGTPEQPDWRGDWSVAHGLHEGGWHCEIGVPLSDVAPGRAVASGAWGVNLCRNWKQEWAWSSLGGAAYKPTEIVRFAPGAPSVSVENRTDLHAGRVEVALSVTNNTSRPAAYLSLLRLERDLMPEARAGGLVTVGPGQTSTTLLRLEDATSRKFTLTASVKDDDIMAMQRTVAWIADRAPWQWVAAQKVVPPPDARFSYYPYRNQMRLLVDVSNMPEGATVARGEAVVRRKGGSEVKRVRFDRLRQGRQELAFDLPPLKGEYEIALRAFGRGVPDVEVVRPFERTVFDWEHNKLGTGPKVYAPFTPIRVVGKRVFTVLRDHTMADSGLWTQVRARGKDLLAGPMRWETGGAVRAEPLRFVESAGHRAVAQARFRAGKVRGSVRATWDYDGMMRVDADLAPIAPTGADAAVDLVIPLRAEQATHYHAMGDGIRNTLYDRVPNGSGVVWSSKQVAFCNDLPPGFCSYVYVGTPVRGLCWFAENDRGWLWDRSTPNVEIVRKSGIVEVRVHVVSRGRKLTGPRRITFGLQAAPVKPRLGADCPHKWRRDNYSLLGTDINWLALGDCGSVYPAHKDLYLWEMIKRGNRERLPELEIAKVVERAKPYFAPYGPDRIASLEAHVRHNLTSRYGTKMVFYYNRASFQLAPEFETFKDEWALSDYRTVEKGSGIYEIQIVPSASC
ncbi:MAG: hypothetical protein FJX72_16185, partial [Armatimonadetes bacterium]|nr:hypothetical protein [Armatimonadota bacterium]